MRAVHHRAPGPCRACSLPRELRARVPIGRRPGRRRCHAEPFVAINYPRGAPITRRTVMKGLAAAIPSPVGAALCSGVTVRKPRRGLLAKALAGSSAAAQKPPQRQVSCGLQRLQPIARSACRSSWLKLTRPSDSLTGRRAPRGPKERARRRENARRRRSAMQATLKERIGVQMQRDEENAKLVDER